MPKGETDPLQIDRGAVIAPAGCGKTQLVARALEKHSETEPCLVLTHTNAGVAALRGRLGLAGVPRSSYRLATIDGWAMRLAAAFPRRSGVGSRTLALTTPSVDYPRIREAAAGLLREGHVEDIIEASYSRIIVDEYQDCSRRQHNLLVHAADLLPTCVLGDPLQAIFGFGHDPLPAWEADVCAQFPVAGELDIPWRWRNAGAEELGQWLLDVRGQLIRGEPVDLSTAPRAVRWVELDGSEDYKRQLRAARVRAPGSGGRVLIIGESKDPRSQRRFASQTPGAVTVEAVDLRDLVSFAGDLDISSPRAFEQVVEFAEAAMTNVGTADLIRRVGALRRSRARREASTAEKAALRFVEQPSYERAADLLVAIQAKVGVRVHRPALLRACIRALNLCTGSDGSSFLDAVIRIREQNRIMGRPLPKRAVGSTLLLKGLEAEVAVLLDGGSFDARNLYVAMTRASQMLVVCSESAVLTPAM